VAMDLLDQCSHRCHCHTSCLTPNPGKLWASDAPRSTRPRFDYGRGARSCLGLDARQRGRLGERGNLGVTVGRRRSQHQLRRLGNAHR
jgi:hypothetical protein